MGLASGAHVSIGGVEYLLDESVDNHYVHTFSPNIVPKQTIQGAVGKEQVKPEKLLWSLDDWAGGEGAYTWFDFDPSTYDYSTGLNGRIKGQLTGRPNREQVQVTSMGDNNQRCYLCVSQGVVYIAGDEKIKVSGDYGATWSAPGGTIGITTGDNVSAVAGDAKYFYYATKSGTNTREIRRLTGSSNDEAVLSRGSSNPAGHFYGMAMMNGKLYAWTGRKLFELDVFETVPLTFNSTYRKVYDTGVDLASSDYGGSAQGSWWADCVAGENAIYFFSGSEGDSTVYEFKDGVGRPLWHLPFGLTVKSIKVQNGVIYAAGHWGGEGTANGFGAMWALPLRTMTETFVGWFRKTQGTNLQMQEMANSYGYQILVGAAKSGRVFVYDAEFNAISLLDDFAVSAPSNWSSDNKIGDMITIGPKRIVAFYKPGGASGTTYETLAYHNDEVTNREDTGTLSWTLDSSEYDFGFPQSVKGLMAFWVGFKVEDAATTSGLLANQRITVKYSLDGGAYATAGTITSATTPSGAKGRVRLLVSSSSATKKFFRLRVQITLDNNSTTSVKPPVLYAVTAEAELLEHTETWDLIVRTKNEYQSNARPGYRAAEADLLRTNLETALENKNIVAFLDGYREGENDNYTSHDVIVTELVDVIDRNAEGAMRVTLRAVPE